MRPERKRNEEHGAILDTIKRSDVPEMRRGIKEERIYTRLCLQKLQGILRDRRLRGNGQRGNV